MSMAVDEAIAESKTAANVTAVIVGDNIVPSGKLRHLYYLSQVS